MYDVHPAIGQTFGRVVGHELALGDDQHARAGGLHLGQGEVGRADGDGVRPV